MSDSGSQPPDRRPPQTAIRAGEMVHGVLLPEKGQFPASRARKPNFTLRRCLVWATMLGLAVAAVISSLVFTRLGPEQEREPVATFDHSRRVVSLAFSPDGATLAGGCRGTDDAGGHWKGEVKLWDVAARRERLSIPQGQWANSVAFSPDGSFLAVACGRHKDKWHQDPDYREVPGEVRVYDPEGRLAATLSHEHGVYVVAFSPDGKLLAAGGGRHLHAPDDPVAEVHLWDVLTWRKVVTLQGLSHGVIALAFSADSKTLAVGDSITGTPGVVRLYSPRAPAPRKTLSVQRGGVGSLAFSPDGSLLVRTEDDGEVALWDPETGAQKSASFQPIYGTSGSVCFGPEGQTLAIAGGFGSVSGRNAEVHVWDVTRGKKLASWTQWRSQVSALAISPDGELLATGGFPQVKVWAMPKR